MFYSVLFCGLTFYWNCPKFISKYNLLYPHFVLFCFIPWSHFWWKLSKISHNIYASASDVTLRSRSAEGRPRIMYVYLWGKKPIVFISLQCKLYIQKNNVMDIGVEFLSKSHLNFAVSQINYIFRKTSKVFYLKQWSNKNFHLINLSMWNDN